MTTAADIYRAIDEFAPFAEAESYDNVGILVGSELTAVTRALIALDIREEVIEQAVREGAQLIVTHHPVIFDPVKRLPAQGYLYRLCQHGLTVLSAHTNLDRAKEGVSFQLAKRLSLQNLTAPNEGEGFLVLGETEKELTALEFSCRVKKALNAPLTRTYDSGKTIKTVAVCSGSGSSMLPLAVRLQADVLVTGDVKHDRVVFAKEQGISLIDGGHYETERIILPFLQQKLSAAFAGVIFSVCSAEGPLFR